MKKILVTMVVLLAAITIALPASAFEVKYGGLFRVRLQANDSVTASIDNDNQNFIDQRLRMFFEFIASENLKVVTGFEVDTLWGGEGSKIRFGHRDTINVEVKHAYVDFMIPCTPVRSKVGLQPLAFMQGWIIDEDFTAANLSATFDPVTVTAGYVSEVNANSATGEGVDEWGQRVDDWYLAVNYAQGPFTAGIVGFYQYGHDAGPVNAFVSDAPWGTGDNLFDLGVNLGYKMDWANFFVNYVQNLGSYDDVLTTESVDYRGFMVEAGANFFYGPFTFNLGGFITSGDDDPFDDSNDFFVYPIGRSHYWSEIMGLGTLENTTGYPGQGDQPSPANTGGYSAGDHPTNIWTVTAGAAWQILEPTKVSFNYYYLGTHKSVLADEFGDTSSSLGHEFDLYLDQKVVDGLMLRLVGAYMIAEDGYSIYSDDPNPWELGARLQWSF
ncbi:MAG: hypothetical protein RBS57_12995 [Desulforhabdus sp.]|jgi:hypothetical protein|nr:hypothetical protein [Desulforhabdus sp.]